MTNAWVIRPGRFGEYEQDNLDRGEATIGWRIGDLSQMTSRDQVRARFEELNPDQSNGAVGNAVGQIWAFRARIQPGDLVVMPSKLRPGYISIGRCTSGYHYDEDPDAQRRHLIDVTWIDEPIAKSVIKDDLLNSLNAIMTVFNPTRNNAGERIAALYEHGTDPGKYGSSGAGSVESGGVVSAEAPSDVSDPEVAPTIDAINDRVRTHLAEHFAGHKLTGLVADILEALGYHCAVSPPGPDGGVDILAGRGPLGMDSPTLIVEVKSEPTPVDVKVVRGLHSAMNQYRADQILLVAMGGLNKPARQEFRRDRATFKVWDSEDLLEHLYEAYERLPYETRLQIPLKRAWVLQEDGE